MGSILKISQIEPSFTLITRIIVDHHTGLGLVEAAGTGVVGVFGGRGVGEEEGSRAWGGG